VWARVSPFFDSRLRSFRDVLGLLHYARDSCGITATTHEIRQICAPMPATGSVGMWWITAMSSSGKSRHVDAPLQLKLSTTPRPKNCLVIHVWKGLFKVLSRQIWRGDAAVFESVASV